MYGYSVFFQFQGEDLFLSFYNLSVEILFGINAFEQFSSGFDSPI